jgi:hypothetical protein
MIIMMLFAEIRIFTSENRAIYEDKEILRTGAFYRRNVTGDTKKCDKYHKK